MSSPTIEAGSDHLALGATAPNASSPHPEVLQADDQTEIVVPGRDFIVSADYQRVGDDLILSGGGREVVIRGYFDHPHPPALATGEGAVISGDVATRLAGPIAPGQYAQLGPPQGANVVGHVETIEGQTTIQHPDGTRVTAVKDTEILQGDVVQTGADGKVGIVFVDKTTLAMGAGARMVIDEMVYDPASHQGSATFSLLHGVFVSVTGEIAKANHDAVHINTPVGSIGIRGTEFAAQIASLGAQSIFALIGGAIEVITPAGSTLLNVPGLTTVSTGIDSAPWAAFNLPAGQFGSLFGGALTISNGLAPFSADPNRPLENPDPSQRGQNTQPQDGNQHQNAADHGQPQNQQPGAGDNSALSPTTLASSGLSSLTDLSNYLALGSAENFLLALGNGLFNSGSTGSHSAPPSPERHEVDFSSGLAPLSISSETPDSTNIWHDGDGSKTLVPLHESETAAIFANPTVGKSYDLVGGADHLQLQVQGEDVTVDLSGFSGVTFHGGDGSDILDASGSTVPILAEGGKGNDVLIGGTADDAFVRNEGDGDHQVFGGGGTDTAIINGGSEIGGFLVSAIGSHAAVSLFAPNGAGLSNAAVDLVDVEHLVINSGDGNDVFSFRPLAGTSLQSIEFNGGAGDDSVNGVPSPGFVIPSGDELTFKFDGGEGFDTLSYSWARAGVDANLSTGIAHGDGFVASLTNFERVIGSNFGDTLTGDSNANTLDGGAGDDRLIGLAGSDTLIGGGGRNTFVYTSTLDGASVATNVTKGAQTGDTVSGFQSGVDKFEFDHAAFSFAPGTVIQEGVNFSTISAEFDGTNAGTNSEFAAGHASFVYSTADHTLYYDGNGAAAGYTVVATIENPTTSDVQAADVHITT